MHLYRISLCKYIEDISGTGAAALGGRWNSKGVYVLYTSSTSSLALLEIIAHGIKLNEAYCMLTLQVPDELIYELSEKDLPDDWQVFPSASTTRKIGDQFITGNQYLGMSVPSAVNELERNILLNPKHPDFKKIKKIAVKNLGIDERLQKRN